MFKEVPRLSPAGFDALFAGRIDKARECWVWTGPCTKDGYGWTRLDGVTFYLHRLSYAAHVGEIELDKPYVLHSCDNPPCCRPKHLFLGTIADNNRDAFRKGRMRLPCVTGESNGAAVLTRDQVEMIRSRYVAGGVFQKQLADEFGVSQAAISKITRGEHWR